MIQALGPYKTMHKGERLYGFYLIDSETGKTRTNLYYTEAEAERECQYWRERPEQAFPEY